MDDLKTHIQMADTLPIEQKKTTAQEQATQQLQAQIYRLTITVESREDNVEPEGEAPRRKFVQKRDSIPRRTVEENSTESDWAFFLAQWSRYTQGAEMTTAQELQQLWAACPLPIQRQLHNRGGQCCLTTLKLLNQMKVIRLENATT